MSQNWFTKMCRNAGLMVHNLTTPADERKQTSRREVNRTVEEKKLNEKMTLRRTTIDEVEITKDDSD